MKFALMQQPSHIYIFQPTFVIVYPLFEYISAQLNLIDNCGALCSLNLIKVRIQNCHCIPPSRAAEAEV